jgi:hypothetical protein
LGLIPAEIAEGERERSRSTSAALSLEGERYRRLFEDWRGRSEVDWRW